MAVEDDFDDMFDMVLVSDVFLGGYRDHDGGREGRELF